MKPTELAQTCLQKKGIRVKTGEEPFLTFS